MKTTFAHKCSLRLLRLYPRIWRERYADEAVAVLEESPATLRTLFDLFLGMLDAHLHAELFTERKFVMLQKLRNSQISIFCSFIIFTVFWAIYSLTGLYAHQSGLPSWDLTLPTPNYAFVFPLVRILGLLAILTTLLGGGAFITAALKQAVARNRQNIPPIACALLSMLVAAQFLGLLILIVALHTGAHIVRLMLPADCIAFLLFILLGNLFRLRQGIKNAELSLRFMYPTLIPTIVILLGIIIPVMSFFMLASRYIIVSLLILVGVMCGGAVYLARQLRRTELTPRFLRFTFILSSITVLAMGAILSLLLYEAQVIYSHMNAQGLGLLRIQVLGVIIVCIASPTIFSCISLWRGFCARRELVLG